MGKFIKIRGVKTLKMEIKPLDNVDQLIIQQFQYIGERAVSFARNSHLNDWNDITGNLRSSIGYVILKDGKVVVNSELNPVGGKKGNGKKGVAAGKKLLKQLQSEHGKGIVLILCAGMEYASYVEEIHHKDVITGAWLLSKQLVDKLLKGVLV